MARPKKDLKPYNRYKRLLQEKKDPFDCPLCSLRMQPKAFERHCKERHGIDTRLRCAWCLGEVSWPSGTKSEHLHHLFGCFRDFLARWHVSVKADAAPGPDPPPPVLDLFHYTLFDTVSQCEPGEWCGRDPVPGLPARAYELTHQTPLEPDSLYAHEGLNLAAACVRLFDRIHGQSHWAHLMVRAVALEGFLRAMDAGECTLLPFSCWCNGGTDEEDRYRHHRHMVVIAPDKKRFEDRVYDRIRLPMDAKRKKNFRVKASKVIEDAYHLIHVLGYLSRRESNCAGGDTFEDEAAPASGQHFQHFHIFTPLPVEHKQVLALQWQEGLDTLLRKERFRNVSTTQFVDHPYVRQRGRVWQKIKYLYNLERHRVLPVRRRFAPTTRETEHFVFLYGGDVLYFEASEENERLGDGAWLRKQVEGGNRLFECAVGEHMWDPNPTQQAHLNDYAPQVELNATLTRKLAGVQQQLKEAKEEIHQLVTFYQTMERNKNEEIIRLKMENFELKRKNSLSV